MTGALYTHHEGHTRHIYHHVIQRSRGRRCTSPVCLSAGTFNGAFTAETGGEWRAHTHALSLLRTRTHTRTYTAVGQIKRFLPVTEAGSALREETRPSVCVRSRLGSVRLGPVRTVISGVCPGAAAGLCRRRRKSAETKLRSVFLRPQPDCQTKTHTRNIRSQPSK